MSEESQKIPSDKSEEEKPLSSKVKDYFKNLFDFSEFDRKTIVYIVFFLFLFFISLYLLYYIYFVDETFIYRLVIEWFVNPIHLLGFLGILLFILIMAIQGLIVPIPSEIVLLATGMVWGIIGGGIMGIIGSMAAGLLCFYISRKGGRPLAEKFVGKSAIDMADEYIHKYGIATIIVARFLPFIAFDPISYASGIIDLDVKKYSFGTFLGSIPRAFFYSFLGDLLISNQNVSLPLDLGELPRELVEAQAAAFNNVMLIVFGILAVIFVAYYITSRLWEKKRQKEE
ncbi:MAG: TVP38/TMEM64 family inner membrane protein YdjZ [Promethearchaeota archaeon]|nr:MAG: TVP38/TMEM64 family inner membrane protein YdjZ [Candidatus Lokiarchaeota archaeon]